MSVYIYIYTYILSHTCNACSLKFQMHHHCLEPSCQNSFSSWSSCCLINIFFWGELCPIFLNLQDLSGLVRLTILYPKVQPQPSILCPKCFCESRVVFARALGVGFFLGRSCFHGWRLGKATKIRVGNPSFPGFLRFILCILYNIKLIWTPHKECMKNFQALDISQLRPLDCSASGSKPSSFGTCVHWAGWAYQSPRPCTTSPTNDQERL